MSTDAPSAATWRELAVARSLDTARTRAEQRVQRFLDSALALMTANPDREFTVQEVVEHSGQSLRSFYQYFGGKHELLLALFEESIHATADQLRTQVDAEGDPLEQLHRFVIDYFELCRPTKKAAKGRRATPPSLLLSEFGQQLLTSHPTEAARAFVPLVSFCDELLREAVAAGSIRHGLDTTRIAGVLLQSIMFHPFSMIIAGLPPVAKGSAPAEQLWDLFLAGLAPQP